MTITYALIQMVEKIAERTDKAQIITKARAHKLVMGRGICTGLVYEKAGSDFTENGPVISCSGSSALISPRILCLLSTGLT